MFEKRPKVSFNIASEASYVYIWNGQKLIKKAKNSQFWKSKVCSQTVLPDRSLLIEQKLVENTKIQMRHFEWVIFKQCAFIIDYVDFKNVAVDEEA